MWPRGAQSARRLPITRDEASAAAAPFSHSYDVPSAGQPDGRYQGSVSLTYEVRWEATGAGSISGSVAAFRSGDFSLAVAKAEAINTG